MCLMARYMLSVHSVEGEAREPMTAEEMQRSWQQIHVVEKEMHAAGAWVFSARLHGPDTATVVREARGEILTTMARSPRPGSTWAGSTSSTPTISTRP